MDKVGFANGSCFHYPFKNKNMTREKSNLNSTFEAHLMVLVANQGLSFCYC